MPPKKRNGNGIKQWCITFPKLELNGYVTDKLCFAESFPDSVYSICCSEDHEDGTEHLHLGLILKHEITFPKMLDYIKAKYPKDWKRIEVEAARDISNWESYCKKEDPFPHRTGNFELVKRGGKTKKPAKLSKQDQAIEDFGHLTNLVFEDCKARGEIRRANRELAYMDWCDECDEKKKYESYGGYIEYLKTVMS